MNPQTSEMSLGNQEFISCSVRYFPGTLQASVCVAVYGTWLRSRRRPKTVRNAAAALKRIVKEDTKTRTASTRDLWGVIIRAPIQQFRWKFWKPALGTASFMKVLHLSTLDMFRIYISSCCGKRLNAECT